MASLSPTSQVIPPLPSEDSTSALELKRLPSPSCSKRQPHRGHDPRWDMGLFCSQYVSGHPLAVKVGVLDLGGPCRREREKAPLGGLLSLGWGKRHPPAAPFSLQVWLPAMKAKGLEISGTFTRQVGSISMDLQLTNKALQVMTDFAIQFNRNR